MKEVEKHQQLVLLTIQVFHLPTKECNTQLLVKHFQYIGGLFVFPLNQTIQCHHHQCNKDHYTTI